VVPLRSAAINKNEYYFIDRWRVKADLFEVADILKDSDFTRWWHSTYREIKQLFPGDKDGLGSVGVVRAKGWLLYTINFIYRITETSYPNGYALEAWGDLTGNGRWTLEQEGSFVNVTYE
jgi:hypothetical protein